MNPDQLLKTIPGLLRRALFLLLGLGVALGLLVVALLLLAFWGLRALWARLTGRPVQPLLFTVLRKASWQRVYPSGARPAAPDAEVIDVSARQIDAAPSDRLDR